MVSEPSPEVKTFIQNHRVARLATASAQGSPHVVPICYAYDGQHIYLAIDQKPKRVSAGRLKRVRNILANPRAAVVIDNYTEDWSLLAYVLAYGRAELVESGPEQKRAISLLNEKYPQYRSMGIEGSLVIKITCEEIIAWGNLGGSSSLH